VFGGVKKRTKATADEDDDPIPWRKQLLVDKPNLLFKTTMGSKVVDDDFMTAAHNESRQSTVTKVFQTILRSNYANILGYYL
jgi:hypothetical protein